MRKMRILGKKPASRRWGFRTHAPALLLSFESASEGISGRTGPLRLRNAESLLVVGQIERGRSRAVASAATIAEAQCVLRLLHRRDERLVAAEEHLHRGARDRVTLGRARLLELALRVVRVAPPDRARGGLR